MFAAIIRWWRGACGTWCREGHTHTHARAGVCVGSGKEDPWRRLDSHFGGKLTLWCHSLWTKNCSLKKGLMVWVCQNPQIWMFHMLVCSTRIHVCEMRPGMAASPFHQHPCKPVQKEHHCLTILCYAFQVFSIEAIISTVVQFPHQQEAFHLIYMVIEYKYPVVCNRLYLTESSSDCF